MLMLPYFCDLAVMVYVVCESAFVAGRVVIHLHMPLPPTVSESISSLSSMRQLLHVIIVSPAPLTIVAG